MSNLTILMILSHFPDTHNAVSGIFYKRIVDEILSNSHFSIIVISPTPNFSGFRRSKQKITLKNNENSFRNLIIYRPKYIPFPTLISKRIKTLVVKKAVIDCIRKNKLNFDIVDSRYAFPWCYIGMAIAHKYRKPAVSTFIGDDINTDIFNSSYILNSVNKIVTNTTIITVSSELKKVTEKVFDINGVNVIYDGIKFSELDNYRQIHKSTLTNKLCPTIGFVGQLSENKGCITILEIIKKTNGQCNWIIVGDGPLLKEFVKLENVITTGNIHPDQVFTYYQKMDVILFPTYKEGIPNVLKEAAFFEIPIIASAVGGIPEMTNDGKFATLIEDFKNPDYFIKALDDYRNNRTEYVYKAQQLKEFVIEKFDITTNVSKLIELYKAINSTSKEN